MQRVAAARRAGGALPELKVTLLFGVGQDLDNLGLRFFFEQVDDTILINIPGAEQPRWNFGISGLKDVSRGVVEDQVKKLIEASALGSGVPHKIAILATHGGVAGVGG